MESINWLMAIMVILALAIAVACSAEGAANDDDDDGGLPTGDDDSAGSGTDDDDDDNDSSDDDDDDTPMECWEVWAMCEYEHPEDGVPDECGDIVHYDQTHPETWGPYAIYMACVETLTADWYGALADCGESGGCADDWKDDSYRCYESYYNDVSASYIDAEDYVDWWDNQVDFNNYLCNNI